MKKLQVTFQYIGDYEYRQVCVLVNNELANNGLLFDKWFVKFMPVRTRILTVHSMEVKS